VRIARSHDIVIYAGSINRDHVHMLIGIPSHLSVSRAVQEGEKFTQFVKRVCGTVKEVLGQHLWARDHWVATSGQRDP
jgi:putative transposase